MFGPRILAIAAASQLLSVPTVTAQVPQVPNAGAVESLGTNAALATPNPTLANTTAVGNSFTPSTQSTNETNAPTFAEWMSRATPNNSSVSNNAVTNNPNASGVVTQNGSVVDPNATLTSPYYTPASNVSTPVQELMSAPAQVSTPMYTNQTVAPTYRGEPNYRAFPGGRSNTNLDPDFNSTDVYGHTINSYPRGTPYRDVPGGRSNTDLNPN